MENDSAGLSTAKEECALQLATERNWRLEMSSYFRQNTSEQGSHLMFNNLMSSCDEDNIITLKSVSSPD